jgi:hypothetical protein
MCVLSLLGLLIVPVIPIVVICVLVDSKHHILVLLSD